MKSEQLEQVREACKQQMIDTLMTLVRENGTDYNDYYRDEHGIEEDEGYTVTKVLLWQRNYRDCAIISRH